MIRSLKRQHIDYVKIIKYKNITEISNKTKQSTTEYRKLLRNF